MVDLELIHAMPSTSNSKSRAATKLSFSAISGSGAPEDRSLGVGRRVSDQNATSGNITPSSPGSEGDINTNEATRGGSTFEMVSFCFSGREIRLNLIFILFYSFLSVK